MKSASTLVSFTPGGFHLLQPQGSLLLPLPPLMPLLSPLTYRQPVLGLVHAVGVPGRSVGYLDARQLHVGRAAWPSCERLQQRRPLQRVPDAKVDDVDARLACEGLQQRTIGRHLAEGEVGSGVDEDLQAGFGNRHTEEQRRGVCEVTSAYGSCQGQLCACVALVLVI